MLIVTLLFAFDASHCQRKCQNLFADSPAKLISCKDTCEIGIFDNKKSTPARRVMSSKVVDCLGKCNNGVNKSTSFLDWSKCRKDCLRIPGSKFLEYYDEQTCRSHCDRHWKFTVYWRSCTSQCQGYAKSGENAEIKEEEPKGIFATFICLVANLFMYFIL